MGHAAKRTRENRTLTVDFQDETPYFQLFSDGKAFVALVLAFLLSLGFKLTHKATGGGGGCLTRHSARAGRCRGLCRYRTLLDLKVHVRIPALEDGAQCPV